MATNVGVWRCTVCGFIHRGPEPPAQCPVCGVGREAFEPHAEELRLPTVATLAWRCLNCTYVHLGGVPPTACPVCGAASDRFQGHAETARESTAPAEKLRVVVVGAGIAGASAAEAARAAAPAAEIVVLSKEDAPPYYRLNLTRYLAGEVGKDVLPLHPDEWYDDQRIDLRLGQAAESIDLGAREVLLRGGGAVAYDRLVLAAGSHPFVPPIPGSHREGVMTFRSTGDVDAILTHADGGGRVVVLGGGVLGLETAGALARRGARVALLEGFGWLLPRQLTQRAGEILGVHVQGIGVDLRVGIKVDEIVGDDTVQGVRLGGGKVVEGDLLVVTAGVRPNSYLARRSGLEVHVGVVVDNLLRTSSEGVWAAGDVAEHLGIFYGTWGPSQYMGSIAGMNAVGGQVEFGGIPLASTLKVLGIDLFSIGTVSPPDASWEVADYEPDDGRYYRFLFRDGRLQGAILLGDTSLTATVTKLVEGRNDLSAMLQRRPTGRDVVEALAAT
jgi:nitrite reductase (NADH) large subunit